MEPLTLRPLSVGDVLDLSVLIFRRHLRAMFSLGALVILPLFMLPLCATFGVAMIAAISGRAASQAQAVFAAASGLGVMFAFVVIALLGTWLQAGAVASATARILAGGKPSALGAYRDALSRGLHILSAAFLLAIAEGVVGSVSSVLCIGFPLLSIPLTAVVHALFGFAWPAIMLENLDGVEALQRSYRLARPALGRAWLAMTAAGLLATAAWIGPAALALSLMGLLPPIVGGILLLVVGVLIGCLAVPFAHTVMTVMYFDLRVRQEGYDLALRARQIAPEEQAA